MTHPFLFYFRNELALREAQIREKLGEVYKDSTSEYSDAILAEQKDLCIKAELVRSPKIPLRAADILADLAILNTTGQIVA